MLARPAHLVFVQLLESGLDQRPDVAPPACFGRGNDRSECAGADRLPPNPPHLGVPGAGGDEAILHPSSAKVRKASFEDGADAGEIARRGAAEGGAADANQRVEVVRLKAADPEAGRHGGRCTTLGDGFRVCATWGEGGAGSLRRWLTQ